ncbi:MAG: 50S ribosomal protein L3 [Elusimicrobia bacterium]|nr:50S ribosomal protein L3 [Elusimicrobiota bacterium]
MKTITGTKIGMTQIFIDKGEAVPVTVISADVCTVVQKKSVKTDGYNAIQVGTTVVDEKKLSKSQIGHLKKAGTNLFSRLVEIKVENPDEYKIGQEIKSDIFSVGDFVDVTGVSKGNGFQGVIKRHGFSKGSYTHGQSDKLRSPGAIGSQQPQRVLKGLKMAGRVGGTTATVQKLKIVKMIPEKNILLIKGAVPGTKNSKVVISKTVKKVRIPVVVTSAKKGIKKVSRGAKSK